MSGPIMTWTKDRLAGEKKIFIHIKVSQIWDLRSDRDRELLYFSEKETIICEEWAKQKSLGLGIN